MPELTVPFAVSLYIRASGRGYRCRVSERPSAWVRLGLIEDRPRDSGSSCHPMAGRYQIREPRALRLADQRGTWIAKKYYVNERYI